MASRHRKQSLIFQFAIADFSQLTTAIGN